MLISLSLLVVGFLLLGLGAELLVRGSSTIALKLGISPLVIGLTVVAFGTSAPELAVSVESALQGRSAIALGNVIGSNIANVGLILGLVALIYPVEVDRQLIVVQIPLLIASSLLLWLFLLDGQLGFMDGVFLFSGLAGFLYYSYSTASRDETACEILASSLVVSSPAKPTLYFAGMIVVGLLMLVGGSNLFVESAVDLARLLGVSEAIIGLSVVAVGTSIPELATSFVAALRKESALAVGNIVGSNLFNILGILGVTSLLETVYSEGFNAVDYAVMLAYAGILIPFAWKSLRISRFQGFLLLAGYFAFLYYILA